MIPPLVIPADAGTQQALPMERNFDPCVYILASLVPGFAREHGVKMDLGLPPQQPTGSPLARG